MTETSSSTKSYQNKRGSRGIRLFVGDIIKFGASTRYYILEGPESFESSESSEKEKLIEKLNNNRSKINNNGNSEVVTSKDDKGEGGVSWGISMDDDNDEHDGTATTTTSGGGGRGSNRSFSFEEQQQQQQQIPEKYRKELEKITAMKYKLMNLENDIIKYICGYFPPPQHHVLDIEKKRWIYSADIGGWVDEGDIIMYAYDQECLCIVTMLNVYYAGMFV